MISKYHRCGDPTQKCPLSVSKEILKADPKWTCPCVNPNCVDFQEPVPLIDGVTGGKPWVFYSSVAVIALIVLFVLLSGKDPCPAKLEDLQARLSVLDKELVTLTNKPKSASSNSQLEGDASALQKEVKTLSDLAEKAMTSEDAATVNRLITEVKQRMDNARVLSESSSKPEAGSGVVSAEAKSLVSKLKSLQQETEEQQEVAELECVKHLPDFEAISASLASSISKARRLSAPNTSPIPVDAKVRASVSQSVKELKAILAKLETFKPTVKPELPFPLSEANILVGAVPGIADRLVSPLAAAWTESKAVTGSDGLIFIDGGAGKRFVVKPMVAEIGFESLAAGDVALFFADRSPTSAELARFGAGFKESRSVAEVVALDALTLLVHPENSIDTYEVGQPLSLSAAAGPEGSAVRSKAEQFGLRSSAISEVIGEEAAMQDKNVLACGLYHREGQNLRAKRLAVKASKEATALKPSPFTIATEEYLYSYRIVAWTHTKPNQLALDLVAFITSDPGQAEVKQSGFVDLRLVDDGGKVDPAKLAALGEAIGSKTISDARRLSTNIRFEVNDAKLDLKAQADLERITRTAAADYPKHSVVILGFTDSSGGPATNQPLSVKRAESVASQLRSSKVDARPNGLGDLYPIDSNETEAGKARNRRAEVWVVKP